MMRLVLLAGAVTGGAAVACGRPQAENFMLGPSGLSNNSLCAYPPVYYCDDPLATNYQSGAWPSRRRRARGPGRAGRARTARCRPLCRRRGRAGRCGLVLNRAPPHPRAGPSGQFVEYIAKAWTCTYNLTACKDPSADNYYALADLHDPAKCMYGGCTNPDATNYNPSVSAGASLPAFLPRMCRASAPRRLTKADDAPLFLAGHLPRRHLRLRQGWLHGERA